MAEGGSGHAGKEDRCSTDEEGAANGDEEKHVKVTASERAGIGVKYIILVPTA